MKTKIIILLSFITIIIVASNKAYKNNSLELNIDMEQDIKKNYDELWRQVDSLTNRNFTVSALTHIDIIYEKAKKENNTPHLIKTLIYKSRLMDFKEEKSYMKIFEQFDSEIEYAKPPLKNLLHSIKAELLWRYYSNNRYIFIQRTHTSDFDNSDIETWDLRTIIDAIIKEQLLALTDVESLKKTDVESITPILLIENKFNLVRPTLYDFIVHRAIDFFAHEEPSLTRPLDYFKIDNNHYFNVLSDFAKLKVECTDTFSLKYYAVTLFQNLLEFHLDKNNINAVVDLEIQRLKFIYQNAEVNEKDVLLYNAFLKLEEETTKLLANNSDKKALADISFEIANLDYQRGLKYNPKMSDDYKWDIKKAYDRAVKTSKLNPNSTGALNALNLIDKILDIQLHARFENFIPSNTPFFSLISYKNIEKAHFRIVNTDYQSVKKLLNSSRNREEMMDAFLQMKALHNVSHELFNEKDYQNKSTELAFSGLPLGHYLILASDNEDFSYKKGDVSYAFVHVTDLAYLSRRKQNGNYEIFVLDRTHGTPVQNAKLQTYIEEYNYRSRTYETKKWKSFTSDKEGYIEMPTDKKTDYRSFSIEITNNNDFIYSGKNFYQYGNRYDDKIKPRLVTTFFTDRAIYRPGQTVYYKGIVIEHTGNDKKILSQHKTSVKLYDVNQQVVNEQELLTNDFGTFSGTFVIPTGLMTGSMSIRNESGTKYFNVEEYKRPKYEVKFEPVKGLYKINEDIKVEGKAQAYAGNNIDGAEVKYRVVRNTRFPYNFYGWRWGYPVSPEIILKNGTTETNENGIFEIEFTAIPDNKINSKLRPVFNYTVYADVTDITGETRSSQTHISVGYTALLLSVNVPELIEKNNFNNFKIASTNLNGESEGALCDVKIFSLKQPNQTYRSRIWEAPSIKSISEKEFRKLFPKDEYDNENNVSTWEKESLIYSEKVNTAEKKEFFPKDFNKWKSGAFIMEVKATDAFKEEVVQTYHFSLYSAKDKKVPANNIHWVNFDNSIAEPGETVSFVVGTAENDVQLIYEIEYGNEHIERTWLKLNNEQKRMNINVSENHRGNFTVHFTFVKDNRVYRTSELIHVPFTNKMLDIEFATFRDKLKPGEEEEWKIIIKDKKGDLVLAELLTAMYDASLDAFAKNSWGLNILNYNVPLFYWDTPSAFGTINSTPFSLKKRISNFPVNKSFYKLNWFGFNFYFENYYYYKSFDGDAEYGVAISSNERLRGSRTEQRSPLPMAAGRSGIADEEAVLSLEEYRTAAVDTKSNVFENEQTEGVTETGVQVRANFNETAFFYPQLKTNENGEVVVSFTVPESLTKWRIMNFAHTKDLKYAFSENELVTQKELMAVANAPRFFRENDKISFSARVSNLSQKDLKGSAKLQLFDAITMKPIDNFILSKTNIDFDVKEGQSSLLVWDLDIKEGVQAITYRIVAKAGNFSDGEEMTIPVLSNRMLVTESLPLPVRGKSKNEFEFLKLINSAQSKTLKNHKLTLEFTSNPAWYAIQALPYLMEFPYDCSEQIFSRYYANSIASHIANSNPKIKKVFESWRNQSPEALLSNLEKNQELKSLLLEETPWLLNGKNESERKQRIALLFEINKMTNEKDKAIRQLLNNQVSNGAWPWFKGMPDDRYITQHIVTGIGKLNHLGIEDLNSNRRLRNAANAAILYLDNRIREDYDYLKKYNEANMHKDNISAIQIHYLYARSFFKNVDLNEKNKIAFEHYYGQSKKYWANKSRYQQGLIALALHRYDEQKVPADIVRALRENALMSEEMGMYWKDNVGGFYWYQAPIETQALLIEVFDEVANDAEAVEEMKIWLLKQKQTQDWKTTKATSEAIYALILRGSDMLASDELVKVTLGKTTVDPTQIDDLKPEAGTGYFKTSWSGKDIKPEMGKIKVEKVDDGIAWGAVYWQYFEQLDKITTHETPLKLNKKVFVEQQTSSGKIIKPVSDKQVLKVGNKVIIRIELRVDRDMEYVHMKDMRASGFEPVNVFSHYKYQDGLGYYESTRDAATHFFFSYLPKGTYVFEYPLYVTHKGDFSNGITTIQCMYAPEFTSHSEGIRIKVE